MLLLAATDMEQTIAAARAIEREQARDAAGHESDVELVRALETAIAVCYRRPFTKTKSPTLVQLNPDRDGPDASTGLRDLHRSLGTMRNKVYAHTNEGRDAEVKEHLTAAGTPGIAFSEAWWAFPGEWLPEVIKLAEVQRDRFRAEALELRRRLG